jgi:hypothetical protein
MDRKSHHMVLRRSEKKTVKLQSQTGNIQETMENQEEISSESIGNQILSMEIPGLLNINIYGDHLINS